MKHTFRKALVLLTCRPLFICVVLAIIAIGGIWMFMTLTAEVPTTHPASLDTITPTRSAPTTFMLQDAMPILFTENKGQTDSRVRYVATVGMARYFFTPDGLTMSFPKDVVTRKFLNTNPEIRISAFNEVETVSNYFLDPDPKKAIIGAANYSGLRYDEIYSGIVLEYGSDSGLLNDTYFISPGGNPVDLKFRLEGAEQIEINQEGELVAQAGDTDLVYKKLRAYQEIDGRQIAVQVAFKILDRNSYGFEVGSYDKTRTLIIDPNLALKVSTLIGGSGSDVGGDLVVDGSGNLYLTGASSSLNYPVVSPYQATNAGGQIIVLTKVNPTGTAIIWSTYYGVAATTPSAIALDSSNNVFVAGRSNGVTSLPGISAIPGSTVGGFNSFVIKFNSSGSSLLLAKWIGGSTGNSNVMNMVVSGVGEIYLFLNVTTASFPTLGPYQATLAGGKDVALVKIDATGTLVYSTYLGGSGNEGDFSGGLALGSDGSLIVTGSTASTNFPTLSPIQASNGGGDFDIFITKLAASGSSLVYSTYFGGSGADPGISGQSGIYGSEHGNSVVIDSLGRPVIGCATSSSNFPTLNPLDGTFGGVADACAVRLTDAGALDYSTYLGGSDFEGGAFVAVDSSDAMHVAFSARSTGLPIPNAFQGARAGSQFDTYLTKLNTNGSAQVFATYFGGSVADSVYSFSLNSSGEMFVAGTTTSTTFPTTSGAVQTVHAGGTYDLFVAKVGTASCGNGVQEATEQCDDGNANNADACTNSCILGVVMSCPF